MKVAIVGYGMAGARIARELGRRGVEVTVTGQLLVVSCGVKPNTELAASMGIACGRAVIIDDQCRTSHPDVFAVGDCAEHRGIPYGLVGPAWEQADVVVDLLSGVNPDAAYEGSHLVTRLKASGIDLAAMGEVDGDEVVVCRCNNVTKGALSGAFLDGARTPEALTEATQASTGCGTCAEDVAGICKWLGGTVAGLGQAAAIIDAARMNEVSAS